MLLEKVNSECGEKPHLISEEVRSLGRQRGRQRFKALEPADSGRSQTTLVDPTTMGAPLRGPGMYSALCPQTNNLAVSPVRGHWGRACVCVSACVSTIPACVSVMNV